MPRTVDFFVYPGFQLLDLSGPLAAFQAVNGLSGKDPYRLKIVSHCGGPITSTVGVTIATARVGRAPVDTFVVIGGRGALEPSIVTGCVPVIHSRVRGARRVASVCTGAFLLAAAGVLDDCRVTTHWRYATLLQRRYPSLQVDGNRIFVREGRVWTSAGITAGIDLALALIEQDLGRKLARATARELVVYHRRTGGQSQFSSLLELEPDSDRLRRALTYARKHLAKALRVEDLARVACMSPRQFSRAFRVETGESPAKAVERLRVEAARLRVESESESIEVIATAIGFLDPERMRRAFIRQFGHPPQALRRMAKNSD